MRKAARKWRAVICAALAVLISQSSVLTAWAGYGLPDRHQMLAPGQGINSGRKDSGDGEDDEPVQPDPKAWKKINGVCYNGSGVAIPGAITRGIDVSEWQGAINWSKVAASDVDFAFIRIAHGITHVDNYFRANMSGANAAGLPVGTYVYSMAKTREEAIREAQLAIRMMKGYKVSYPVVYDMEDASQGSLSNARRTELALAFTSEIRKAGYYPMVYLNPYWYNYRLDMSRLSGLDLWLAWYGDSLLPPFTNYRYSIWQGTGGDESLGLIPTRGMINGIPASINVDIDMGFVDYTLKVTPRTGPVPGYVPTPTNLNGWVEEDGKVYYYRNQSRVYGAQVIDGRHYRFSSADGSLFRDVLLYSSKTNKTCYAGSSGALVRNQWVTWKGKRYYIGADYFAYTGSRNVGGKYYLFNSKQGFMYADHLRLFSSGDVYYYGADGVRVNKGLTKITRNGVTYTYYFNKAGKAYKGWHVIRGKSYYFYGGRNARSGIRAENVSLMINGELCVFNEEGVCIRRTRRTS